MTIFINDILSISAHTIVPYKILIVLDDNHHVLRCTVIQQGRNGNNTEYTAESRAYHCLWNWQNLPTI